MKTNTAPNKPLNKMQIETAESMLLRALRNKREEMADKEFKADVAKLVPDIKKLNKQAHELRKAALELKKKIEKNTKLVFDIDSYSSAYSKLPKSLEDGELNNSEVVAKDSNYSDRFGAYGPDIRKEAQEIDRFILGLKLGTALLSDLDTMLEKISNIK